MVDERSVAGQLDVQRVLYDRRLSEPASLMSAATTVPPCSTIRIVTGRPIPEPAPVTNATLPSNLFTMER